MHYASWNGGIAARAIAVGPFACKYSAPYLGADLLMRGYDFQFEYRDAARIMALCKQLVEECIA